jgi:hypothetical protein
MTSGQKETQWQGEEWTVSAVSFECYSYFQVLCSWLHVTALPTLPLLQQDTGHVARPPSAAISLLLQRRQLVCLACNLVLLLPCVGLKHLPCPCALPSNTTAAAAAAVCYAYGTCRPARTYNERAYYVGMIFLFVLSLAPIMLLLLLLHAMHDKCQWHAKDY